MTTKDNRTFDATEWITANIALRPTDPTEFLYSHMQSQSGGRLPVIYEPFDPADRGHFVDRGQILDFALHCGGGRVLDFGPGDGWPALLIAPMVRQVVGVEGCPRRRDVCAANAKRLGIANATFVAVSPGQPLPFPDGSFDAVVAASSIEQTPDPKATLAELHRVLRPGGRLRMSYESLGRYRGGKERAIWLAEMAAADTRLVIYDRRIDQELVHHIGLAFQTPADEIRTIFASHGAGPCYSALTAGVLQELAACCTDAGEWTTRHPSCRTWLAWLAEVGFRSAAATYDGGAFAGTMFDILPAAARPVTMQEVDDYLLPRVEALIDIPVGDSTHSGPCDPWIAAVK